MAYTNPTISDFQAYFFRDFPYGTTMDDVQDQDITNAFADALFTFNPALFTSQANYTLGVLLLSAHYLVTNLRNSSQGIAGQFSWLQTSKGVGSVSEGIAIPERILAYPQYTMLTKTNYGAKYLQLILPLMVGQMFTSYADVNP